MTISLAPSEDSSLKALRTFLLEFLPSGVEVIRGQANRVPEPKAANFVVMTPIRRTKLETNVDKFVDTKAFGSIAGSVMTVTAITYGQLKIGSVMFGTGVLAATQIINQLSGSVGEVGTYTVSPVQNMSGSVLAAGVLNAMAPTELTVQLDVHGPAGGDNAQRIFTMLRDDWGFVTFKDFDLGTIPLTAEDPRQMPFINAESQYEDRWIVEACLQVNATVSDIPQQFFDQVVVTFIPVDIVEPA